MKSKIYTGTIEHHRYDPVRHDLSYPIYIYAFDLSDLPDLDRRYPLFGYNRPALTSLRDRDYLQPGDMPIAMKLDGLLSRHQVETPVGAVITITSARYFNYVFNPVNFHYCYAPDQTLLAVVAEVNNTFGERHPYVLTKNRAGPGGWFAEYRAPKAFHVSPFNGVEGDYHFCFSEPGDDLEIRIVLVHEGKKIMAAILKAEGLPLTPKNHMKTVKAYPLAPHLSIPRIYSHAFRLFFGKKLPYHPKPVPNNAMTMRKRKPSFVESLCMRLLLGRLSRITSGSLKLEMPDRTTRVYGRPGQGKEAVMQVKDYGFFERVAFHGEIGFGEAYMHGEWDSPGLVPLIRLLMANRDQLSDGNLAFSFLARFREKLAHKQRENTIDNSPANIQTHYDLSNAFYVRFLDKGMIYSCGIFSHRDDTLETAQERKMLRILAQADIQREHHILEIGCGWGGFAVFAAKRTGCRVTGITVSPAQFEEARHRVKEEGLGDRVTIQLRDYRHATGAFDRIISIEMIEAVGPKYYSAYFKHAQRLLNPGGRMVFQAITFTDDRYEEYCRERDWIQKHIFPGGHLPSLKVLEQTIKGHTRFHIVDIHHMGRHYATTLGHWRRRFTGNLAEIEALGFDKVFQRKWIYYFSICEAGFMADDLDDIQVTLTLGG